MGREGSRNKGGRSPAQPSKVKPGAGSELKPDCSSGLGIKKKKKNDFVVRFQTAKNGV